MISGFSFLTLIEPADPWNNAFEISLYTTDETQIGSHIGQITVALADYPTVPLMTVDFSIDIIQLVNKLPYFMPKLAGFANV